MDCVLIGAYLKQIWKQVRKKGYDYHRKDRGGGNPEMDEGWWNQSAEGRAGFTCWVGRPDGESGQG
ncbi:hypothetical protein FRC10_004467, partial [Ceratobasidium sp. 414]